MFEKNVPTSGCSGLPLLLPSPKIPPGPSSIAPEKELLHPQPSRRSEQQTLTHVDYSARIQTVHRETNPRYHALLSAFKARTGCPVLVNTSFNVRGEPIVCTPEDAFRCFMGTEIEVLAIENCYLRKEDQDPQLALDYKSAFALD